MLFRAKERVMHRMHKQSHLVKVRSVYCLPEQSEISTWSSGLSPGWGSGQAFNNIFRAYIRDDTC